MIVKGTLYEWQGKSSLGTYKHFFSPEIFEKYPGVTFIYHIDNSGTLEKCVTAPNKEEFDVTVNHFATCKIIFSEERYMDLDTMTFVSKVQFVSPKKKVKRDYPENWGEWV